VVIKDVQITKDRTTLGRRPYNDIVIDNLAVSGEHALLQMSGADVYLEDLNSTNGTYVNGKPIRKQMLRHGDHIEIGRYKIRYFGDEPPEADRTLVMKRGEIVPPPPPESNFGDLELLTPAPQPVTASIRVLNGAAAGREVMLTKVVTTLGKPGVQVASITRRPGGFFFAHVEGASRPSINGEPLAADSAPLRNGDVIELAGTRMQFVNA
jgi:pSer/pThr/pTyr-binding forkhead associated (FHA) protein